MNADHDEVIELARSRIASDSDVFAVRSQARQLADRLGLEGQDQIRVAVALSEIGRRLHAEVGAAVLTFSLVTEPTSAGPGNGLSRHFQMDIVADGPVSNAFVEAVGGTRSLVDRWEIDESAGRATISMSRRLPPRSAGLSAAEVRAIRVDVARLTAGTPMEELAENNRQLLATLEQVQQQRDELLRLNAELEETNRGVMALYTELSEELEATNRGVVALYAELDQRADQVRQASESKTRFLANVSHELRAPVASIVGLGRLLLDPRSDPLTDDQRQQLDLMSGSADSLLGLVNELLDLAKAESGRLEPVPEDVDLKAVFDSLRGTLGALPTVNDATELQVDEPDAVRQIRTDPVMLSQVLRNLLTNGLKFTPSGHVRLSAKHAPDEMVELVVEDTGIGIPVSEQERVFEEFHQVRNPIQATVTGTGLGLPYARRLVEILGGTIMLKSAEGEGSTFTVRLPIGAADTESGSGEAAISILVVDDDEAFRTATSGVLRRCGFTVAELADGRSALAAISAQPPDLVFLDLRLAVLDGGAVLDALAADKRFQHIPVIVLTAYPADLVGHPAADRAQAVLDKSTTTLDDLCGVVHIAVGERPVR